VEEMEGWSGRKTKIKEFINAGLALNQTQSEDR